MNEQTPAQLYAAANRAAAEAIRARQAADGASARLHRMSALAYRALARHKLVTYWPAGVA